MTYFNSKTSKENIALKNLKIANIQGKIWLDAGCGEGAYTIPLSQLVSRVIAVDQDKYKIEKLQTLIKQKELSTIQVIRGNFFTINLDFEPMDGILFAFSLHYSSEPYKAIYNLKKYLKSGGMIIIIDYNRITPVPWVPFPINRDMALDLLKQANLRTIEIPFQNNRFYIAKGY